MAHSKWKLWIGLLAAIAVFLAVDHATNWLHDSIFLRHTSIQDGISNCSMIGDCYTEDGVIAYNSKFTAILGNTLSLVFLGLSVLAGYLTFRIIHPKSPKPLNPFIESLYTPEKLVTRYSVIVRDNFHYMDSSEHYESGVFDTYNQALAHSKEIVDDFLSLQLKPDMTKETLYELYTCFGEDPLIDPDTSDKSFSAWVYAKERCRQICEDEPAHGL